jgi:hypothetical protein
LKKFLLLAALPLFLNACSDWYSSERQVDEAKLKELSAFPYELMAPEAPPPPQVEMKGLPPGEIADEYVWRKGHWEYKDGEGWLWKAGYWLRKPAFTAAWKQDAWLKHTYGWVLVPGHWE